MRKPRDFDSELKALADKAKLLKERRVRQLGELVIATGAEALDADMLAGALLGVATNKDASVKESWRRAGAAFFLRSARKSAPRSGHSDQGAAPGDGNAPSA
ncbi:conjugal transfer protein TraD [Sphingopyxis chilensis]